MTARAPACPFVSGVRSDLRVAVLLAGRVGSNPFGDGIQRPVLDLPLAGGRTVLDSWVDRFTELAADADLARLTVRIAIDQEGDEPDLSRLTGSDRVKFEVVRDPADYRGTAGVVRDLTAELGAGDSVLVATASLVQVERLAAALATLRGADEGVTLVPEAGSDVAGLFVLRRARLERVPEVGFVDLKEQALRAEEGLLPLRVGRRPSGATLPIRTRSEYLHALRALHTDGPTLGAAFNSPFAETWDRSFVVVEPGARVAPSAVLQDSVVLHGGVVEDGALVARSVVCRGGVVRRGQQAVETVVADGRAR